MTRRRHDAITTIPPCGAGLFLIQHPDPDASLMFL